MKMINMGPITDKTFIPRPIKISLDDVLYPERIKIIMGAKAPKFLYLIGNIELLKPQSIGFCGSRKASLKGIETAKDCAEQAANNHIIVISGNATGVDIEAHFNSLKAGGSTIIVIPEGIDHFKIKNELKSVWDWQRILIISQFEPNDPWKAFRAMTRNQLIIALSRVMIVIEAGEKGGTMNAGMETLKMGLPLFVAEYEDMTHDAKGNKILLGLGAQRLAKSKITHRANMQHVIEQVQTDVGIQHALRQGKLF
ncbi:MAG: DNA-processing protein DprA [Alphaproteobacteria bacterium]|nr:DNA-processing protein DprA [Alphaproteobacteria bacterium]